MSKTIFIEDQQSWDRVAEALAPEPLLALDTESNSLYAYQEQVCLIQIAAGEDIFLLDPLAVSDLSALGSLLANPSITIVAHGSDYDVRCLHRDYGFTVRSLFDTELAARFLGIPRTNLSSVLEGILGVGIPKSRALQTSDWGRRPLSQPAVEYAASDVQYLLKLAGDLQGRLATLRRLDWVTEECQRLEQVRQSPPDPPETAMLRVKGSSRLGHRDLAVLKELFLFREEEARRMDCPPFRVLTNEALLTLAGAPDLELHQVRGLPGGIARRSGDLIREAIQRGTTGPEVLRPARARDNPWGPESNARLRSLKGWRTRHGALLDLDPALLWPAASLERLALHWNGSAAQYIDGGAHEVRDWQRREFSQELRTALVQAYEEDDSSREYPPGPLTR